MPELPEIEAIRRRFESRAVGRGIDDVEIRDGKALRGTSQKNFSKTIRGTDFSDAMRHGKVLFARAGDGPRVVMHFGMTGDLAFPGPDEDLPEHARVVFTLEDGGRVAFDNPRKFGWLELTGDIDGYLDENDLGPDALSLPRKEFAEIIGGTRGQVKPALMDQSKLAGIGNVYSDEILFRARIRPDAKGNDLTGDQLDALHKAMEDVLQTASNRLYEGKTLPDSWLARHRDADEACPRCGSDLDHAKIGGRTAWFCPSCQDGGNG